MNLILRTWAAHDTGGLQIYDLAHLVEINGFQDDMNEKCNVKIARKKDFIMNSIKIRTRAMRLPQLRLNTQRKMDD